MTIIETSSIYKKSFGAPLCAVMVSLEYLDIGENVETWKFRS